MLLDYFSLLGEGGPPDPGIIGELYPIRLDGSMRLADVLRDRRDRARQRAESLLLLGSE